MSSQSAKANVAVDHRRRGSWKRRLALLGGSTLLSLGLAEIFLRIVEPPPAYVPDPVLGVRASVGPDRDTHGFRNESIPARADIVALGDSQTEGYGTAKRDEAWPQVLGQLTSLKVYNMGVCGYGAVQYSYLLDEALALRPRVVAVGFYLGNDLADAFLSAYGSEHWKSLRNPALPTEDAQRTSLELTRETSAIETRLSFGAEPDSLAFKLKRARTWARTNIRIYARLGDLTRGLRHRLSGAPSGREPENGGEDVADFSSSAGIVYQGPVPSTVLSASYRERAVDLGGLPGREGWRITSKLFLEMRDKAEAGGAKLLLVVIPTKEMVYLDHMAAHGETIPDAFVEYAAKEKQVNAAVAEYCTATGIPCVFTLPALASALSQGARIYPKSSDGHPLPEGYRVIARAVHDALVKNAMIPVR